MATDANINERVDETFGKTSERRVLSDVDIHVFSRDNLVEYPVFHMLRTRQRIEGQNGIMMTLDCGVHSFPTTPDASKPIFATTPDGQFHRPLLFHHQLWTAYDTQRNPEHTVTSPSRPTFDHHWNNEE